MHRLNHLYLTVIYIVVITGLPLHACTLRLTPATATVHVDERVTFNLYREPTHMDCAVPLEKMTVNVDGGEVVGAPTWQGEEVANCTFTVRFARAGSASVRIFKGCDQLPGVVAEASVIVQPVTQQETPAKPTTPDNTIRQDVIKAPAKRSPPAPPPILEATPGIAVTPQPVRDRVEIPALKNTVTEETHAAPPQVIEVPAQVIPMTVLAPPGYHFRWRTPVSTIMRSTWFWLAGMLVGLMLYLFRVHAARTAWLVIALVMLGFYLRGCPCPIGAVYSALTGDINLLLIVPVLLSLLWGRVFCGWVCPAGAIQELLRVPSINRPLPTRLERVLKGGKYLVLVGFAMPIFTGAVYPWGNVDPFRALFNLGGTSIALWGLGLVSLVSIAVDRPFCRFACPLGALLTLTSRICRFRIIRSVSCAGCQRCLLANCPTTAMTATTTGQPPTIDEGECIRCQKCLALCPAKNHPRINES